MMNQSCMYPFCFLFIFLELNLVGAYVYFTTHAYDVNYLKAK